MKAYVIGNGKLQQSSTSKNTVKLNTSRTSSAVGVYGPTTTVGFFRLIDKPLTTDAAIIFAGFDKTISNVVNVEHDRTVTDQH